MESLVQVPAKRERRQVSLRYLWIIPLVLAAENTAVVQIPHPWFVIYLYRGVPIVFGLSLLFFGRSHLRALRSERFSLNPGSLALHITTAILFVAVEGYLIHAYPRETVVFRAAVGLWLLLIPTLVLSLLGSFIPFRRWFAIARMLGTAWLYAALCSAVVVISREALRRSWDQPSSRVGDLLQNASFGQTKSLLELLYPVVVSDPASHVLGTENFVVAITGTCSGIEGLALISAFMMCWFLFARRELRLARALLLVPVALGLMWVLNLARLVALISIGNAGYPRVAINGFHTEAGWIAFTLVSVGFLLVAQNLAWFHRAGEPGTLTIAALQRRPRAERRNIAAIYLAPFLAITAAALVSQAAADNFEWLYPLRFVAVLVVCWVFRREYRSIDWKFGPLGVLAGVVVAAIWLGVHVALAQHGLPNTQSEVIANSLALLTPGERTTWIAFRVLAAILTVPLAEELAFRGYIARRVMASNVESVPYAQLNVAAIVVSSIAFGVMHGHMWAVGIVAGAVFALVARMRNRLGEAVAAHVTANLILAVIAVMRGDYTLW